MASEGEDGVLGPEQASDDGYLMLEPWVKKVAYESGVNFPYKPIWDISDPDKHHNAVFSVGTTNRSGVTVPPTPLSMSEMFLPNFLLDRIANLTNKYAAARLPPAQRMNITRAEILRFFAIYYYMGLVRLPYKRDYWRAGSNSIWPHHVPCQHISRKTLSRRPNSSPVVCARFCTSKLAQTINHQFQRYDDQRNGAQCARTTFVCSILTYIIPHYAFNVDA